MTELHAALAAGVDAWRADGYPHDRFPAITEILQFAIDGEDPDARFQGLVSFELRLDTLPDVQRELWPRLERMPLDAVLYGGTAIALRLAHRASVDFYFFLPR